MLHHSQWAPTIDLAVGASGRRPQRPSGGPCRRSRPGTDHQQVDPIMVTDRVILIELMTGLTIGLIVGLILRVNDRVTDRGLMIGLIISANIKPIG